MAITTGAKKAIRTARRRRVFNERRTRVLRDVAKKVRRLIDSADRAGAEKLLPEAYQAIDKAAKRGVIKPNAAARKKSRLTAALRRIAKK